MLGSYISKQFSYYLTFLNASCFATAPTSSFLIAAILFTLYRHLTRCFFISFLLGIRSVIRKLLPFNSLLFCEVYPYGCGSFGNLSVTLVFRFHWIVVYLIIVLFASLLLFEINFVYFQWILEGIVYYLMLILNFVSFLKAD